MSDWWCKNCNFKVFGSKDSCKCGNTRSNNQQKSKPKSNNDWWCNTCKFMVFGSKTECSKCKVSRIDNANRDSNVCPICDSSDSQKKVLNCGHVVCNTCLNKIKETNNKCPFCKVQISSSMNLFI